MKAIMISDKPKWCALIMNDIKKIEVRKNKALANAIQKLIDENGYADIYGYCSKDNYSQLCYFDGFGYKNTMVNHIHNLLPLNGKVLFKFRCYKVEEIAPQMWTPKIEHEILEKSCLKEHELFDYICSHDGTKDKPFYAIHISDLEIFDKPKELSEFRHSHCNNLKNIEVVKNYFGHYVFQYFDNERCSKCKYYDSDYNECLKDFKPLTKAPQNFCYIEVE